MAQTKKLCTRMGCNTSNKADLEDDVHIDQIDEDGSDRENHKVVLVGDKAVGKSSIVMRYTKNHFSEGHTPTIGAAFVSKDLDILNSENNSVINMHAFLLTCLRHGNTNICYSHSIGDWLEITSMGHSWRGALSSHDKIFL